MLTAGDVKALHGTRSLEAPSNLNQSIKEVTRAGLDFCPWRRVIPCMCQTVIDPDRYNGTFRTGDQAWITKRQIYSMSTGFVPV